MSYNVSRTFWKGLKNYPDYPHLYQRRFLDLCFVLENLENEETFLDLGCGDCYMLILLRELTEIKKLYGIDISENIIRNEDKLIVKSMDLTNDNIYFPYTDITISFGMFPYIFEEIDLKRILFYLKSNKFLVRLPCTSKKENEYINKYSEDLNSNYSAIYRTVESYKKILSGYYDVQEPVRAYPDEIESKYGTKHYYFICRR